MARRLHQTLADYIVLAISPGLIVMLVGSLVFFLIAVFYQGSEPVRLTWVMACFVFAAVLIARISIEQGLERAMPFGIALAVAVGMALNSFLQFRGDWIGQFGWIINWGLIAVVWWSAHKLTWDCTMIDDSQDASGEGLLQVAGLERPADQRNKVATPAGQAVEGTTSRDVPAGWWQRYVEHQRRPHAPGVWVVYFSLAALPLFGLGQWFIPAADIGARRRAFWLLGMYVASGMGLLLTTSFLGLRRYLRQRRIEMPTQMASLWLGMGAAIIVALLVIAALLPRPSAEYSIATLPFTVGSPHGKSSRYAPVPREGVEDEEQGPAPASDEDEAEPGNATTEGEQAESSSEGQGQGKRSGQSEQKGQQSGQSKSGKQQSDGKGEDQSNRDQSSGSEDSQNPQDESARSSREEAGKQQTDGEQQRQAKRQPQGQESNNASRSENQDDGGQQEGEPQDDQQQDDQEAKQDGSRAAQPSQPSAPMRMPTAVVAPLGWLGELLKWAFYAAFVLLVVYFVWRYRAEVLAALRDFLTGLREFWAGLFGGRRQRGGADDAPVEIKVPPSPFSTYADPFATGVAARYPLEELVRYSFEAFEAWSREHGCQREPEQTPHELAREVAKLNAFIRADARNVAELYSRVAYAEGELPDTARQQLEQLWQVMRQSAARPQ